MSINETEWKQLTESKFWRPEIGKGYTLVLSHWSFDMRIFKDDASKEQKPTLVFNVDVINGEEQNPRKEFSTSNKALNHLFMAAVKKSEREGRSYIKVHLLRLDQKNYQLVDLTTVEEATRNMGR